MVFGPLEAGYSLHLTNRGSSPCADYSYRTSCQGVPVPYYATGLKVAPTHPDDVPDFRVTTHHVILSVPVG
jgi:hypothetical protein